MLSEKEEVRAEEEREEREKFLIFEAMASTIIWGYVGLGASQVTLVVKSPPANAGDQRCRFDPWARKILWRRAWQLTPVFLSGESQRILAGQSPWGHKELDITEGI